MKTIPFTYVITFKPTGQRYYGCRFAKGCQPSDLWSTYFTSSNVVKNLIDEYGVDAFIYQIRRLFSDSKSCRLWEYNVIKRLKVSGNVGWLNRRPPNIENLKDLSGKNNPMYGSTRSDLSKRNSSTKGFVWITNGEKSKQVHPKNIYHYLEQGYYRGLTQGFTEESKSKIRESRKGKPTTKNTKVLFKDGQRKHVSLENVEDFIKDGWTKNNYKSPIARSNIYQVKNNIVVAKFVSVSDAERKTEFSYHQIYTSIKHEKIIGGFIWKKD